jgi:hypothetical protein
MYPNVERAFNLENAEEFTTEARRHGGEKSLRKKSLQMKIA